MSRLAVVWFKRDLRSADHAPLLAAALCNAAVGLYVLEDEWLSSPEWDPQHWAFARESLHALRTDLAARGLPLLLRCGKLPEVLQELRREYAFTDLLSHEETGSGWTYARDKRVRDWCRQAGVRWQEWPQFGVIRPLRDRDAWAKAWDRFMSRPLRSPPERFPGAPILPMGELPSLVQLGRPGARPIPAAGEAVAARVLQDFLRLRSRHYLSTLSSPSAAEQGCSRLSVYLAFGNISMARVVQDTRAQLRVLHREFSPEAQSHARHLRGFLSRLHWHCHFMQKLEDEPAIEFHNFARVYDGLREDSWREEYFTAWINGQTGYPLVDACMRSLRATGWLNFRMRAMLVSFASYHLWLHWRQTGLFLARQFLDFEPGIHWSQMQMQSGTTGINTLRIYSPSKQMLDQDPKADFVRRWVPEWGSSAYPAPIVPEKLAAQQAKERIWARRRLPEARTEAQEVLHRHGSRKGRKKPTPKRAGRHEQLELFD